ncbi:hypothetical protein [Rubinisphaera brasiliensis]|uniref:Uncharacterized protein n=1 Tax=Rubinisphaera brasiliensis (strain ATCC 49424 / DSM 5305 / JCM 21570 / IAM 15109 / NBRC 103401 / IFAM 1448) TaxID=756272 RepID=F0SNL0_RUBBR|nr:hypothetical protein [Rubinisphaera brasiliensis]ADY57844.1 hypothetical protein Plabr_0215 [Rubinisphaera brasiliensis DSM 5305]
MSRTIQHASTDQDVILTICNSDGTPKEDVVYNSSGIALWYRRQGGSKVAITPATLASLTTSHTDGGFLHIDDGQYRLDVPDAAFASGATHVTVGGTVDDGVILPVTVALVAYDPQSVRVGAAAAGAQMDLVNAPNSTAVSAIQSGLSTFDPSTDEVDANVVSIEDTDATDYFTAMIAGIWGYLAASASTVGSIGKLIVDRMPVLLRLDDTMEDDGGGTYRFTEDALAEAPTGSGGGSGDISVTITPVRGRVGAGVKQGERLTIYLDGKGTVNVTRYDGNGDQLEWPDSEFVFAVGRIESDQTETFLFSVPDSSISVSGDNLTLTADWESGDIGNDPTTISRDWRWSVREADDDDEVLVTGPCSIEYAP